MPGFQSVPNTAEFECRFTALGEAAQFSVHVRNDADPWDEATLTDMATAIGDAIKADYKAAFSVDHSFLGVVARDLEAEFGRVVEVFEPAPVPGTLASPSLPANVAVTVALKSATGAPRRGHWSFLPPAESQVTGNLLTGGAATALDGAAQAIHVAAQGGADDNHVIISRFSGMANVPGRFPGTTVRKPVARGAGVTAVVAAVQVKSRIGSQKGRLPRSA